ncbi:MAG: L-threonylcarbamoyladenylate synthase [Candidatus Aenigmatarchaeota archaeon]
MAYGGPAALRKAIKEAAAMIKAGGLVAYPTETVYGLGANAFSRVAVLKVFAAKRRPLENPLSVAVKDLRQADEVAYVNTAGRKLAKAFLPGPLTIVLKMKAKLPKELTAGSDKVGIRIPRNDVALRLIELAGPITATSANISGQPSITTAGEARERLGDRVDFVLDGGPSQIGVESTVVDVSEEGKCEILRDGAVARAAIRDALR